MWKRSLFLTLFFSGVLSAEEAEFSLSDFSGGLYSNQSGNRIPDNAVTAMENFYSDIPGECIERNGYEKRDTTILGGTKAVTGLWEFVDNTGQQWIISFSSQSYYRNTLGNTPTKFGQNTTVNTPPDCAVNLGKIWCVNGTDNLWWFDGSTTGTVTGAPIGTLIEPWRTRVVIANITSAQSTVRFSADGDGTTWTLGGLATDPFAIQIGGANDGFNVTCLWGSYLDNLIAARKKDTWYVSGFDQADVELRNISKEIGCIQAGTMREFDGSLLFLSNRGMEEMRGITITNISEPIRDITDSLIKNTGNFRSTTLDSQSDFSPGTDSPLGWTSTSISPGSVVLSTAVGVVVGSDTTKAEFDAGTLTNLESNSNGSINLTIGSQLEKVTCYDVDSSSDAGCSDLNDTDVYFSFTATTSYQLQAVTLRLRRQGSNNDPVSVILLDDNGGVPYNCANSPTGCSTYIGQVLGNSVPTTASDVKFTLTAAKTITSGQRYWIYLTYSGCGGSNRLEIFRAASSCDTNEKYYFGISLLQDITPPTNSGGNRYKYKLHGATYTASGNIVSRTFDVGISTNIYLWEWGTFLASGSIPSGTAISYETQVATSSGGPFDSLVSVSSGSNPTSAGKRFIRYKASFATNQSTSPVLNEVILNIGAFRRPVATYVSPVINVGNFVTSWGPLTISDAFNGGSIVYQFNASTSPTVAEFNPSSWTTIISGQVPTNGATTYALFRSSFSITSATQAPSLNSFQITWNEGGTGAQPLVSWNFDRRYWLAYTTATTSGARNDRTVIYQRNRTWTIFKLPIASFATWRDKLYFGDSNDTGYVYKFDVGNTDDGNAITSVLRSKSYDLKEFNRDKEFRNAYVNYLGNTGFSGSYSLTYDLDRNGGTYSLGSANMNESAGQISAKFPFPVSNPVVGKEIQYSIYKSGTGDRLKIYDIRTVFNLLEPD